MSHYRCLKQKLPSESVEFRLRYPQLLYFTVEVIVANRGLAPSELLPICKVVNRKAHLDWEQLLGPFAESSGQNLQHSPGSLVAGASNDPTLRLDQVQLWLEECNRPQAIAKSRARKRLAFRASVYAIK